MKYILAVILTPTFGGPHNQILRLNNSLKKKGYEYIVLTPDEKGTGTIRLKSNGISVINRDLHRPRKSLNPRIHLQYISNFLSDVKFIQNVIIEHKIDLVQLCGLFNIQGAIAAKRSQVPIVWQLLSNFAPKWLRNTLSPFVKSYADVIMTTGTGIAREHLDIIKFKNLVPFYPPVDCKMFESNRDKRKLVREYLKIPDDSMLIGTIGNQNRQKAHENFLEIAFGFKRKFNKSSVYFRIIGNKTDSQWPYYKAHVIDKIASLDLEKDNFLTVSNPQFDVSDYLSAFDIFLLTSKAEGVPTVILESMASSLPIVSSNVGAISEVVKEGVNGYLYSLDNLSKAVNDLGVLVNDISYTNTIGMQNKKECFEKYDVSECAKVHINAFRRAIESNGK